MELIKVENDSVVLNQAVIDKICQFELEMKQLKNKQDELREKIKNEMEKKDIKGITTDIFSIAYVEEFDKITVDTKMLKEKYPDIVDECSKISHTKSQIKITFKK